MKGNLSEGAMGFEFWDSKLSEGRCRGAGAALGRWRVGTWSAGAGGGETREEANVERGRSGWRSRADFFVACRKGTFIIQKEGLILMSGLFWINNTHTGVAFMSERRHL
jgi:hypothetical protein